MRYERLESLLELVAMLQSSIVGVSLSDIQDRFSISRRTAERMRDAVARAFPQMEVVLSDDQTKRWRVRSPALNSIASVGPDALTELQLAAASLRRRGLQERAALLEATGDALRAAMQPAVRSRLEPDIAALMEAEGIAARAGPREYLTAGLITTIREAIKSCRLVRIRYQAEHTGEARTQRVAPYGLLYGDRSYLVARGPGGTEPHLYRLSRITAAELASSSFVRPESFSIEEFAARSFGVYQERSRNIRLRFSALVADEARSFIFHSSQVASTEADGSLLISFKAGGLRELCWFLFSWGVDVVIEAPVGLSRMFDGMIRDLGGRIHQKLP
jgi:predicted DNA-binding transcriptional regulator YafY